MSLKPRKDSGLEWLTGLRWGAAGGQVIAALVVRYWLGSELPVIPLAIILLITVGSNLWLVRLPGEIQDREALTGSVMALDVCLLTALLYWTGGPSNPFSVLYLVHVTLSAAMLSPRWALALVVLSVAGFGVLFFWHVPLSGPAGESGGGHPDMHHHGPGETFSLHLQGMWVAYALTAALIAWFVVDVSERLRRREQELEKTREIAARNERLASLATLAAGAAHELGSPLATIAVAAGELERSIGMLPEKSGLLDDANLIRQEVKRCREILGRMSTEAGESSGEMPRQCNATELVNAALLKAGYDGDPRIRVSIEPFTVLLPYNAVAQAVANLVRNAVDAAGPEGQVEVEAARSGRQVCFAVRDDGPGMSPGVRSRAGEPFFTTKPAGQGMGLGLFLVRGLAERLSGSVDIDSVTGGGTLVKLTVTASGDSAYGHFNG